MQDLADDIAAAGVTAEDAPGTLDVSHNDVSEVWRTGGKINLFLRITGRRSDGYHELSTLFLPLPEPCDTLIIGPAKAPNRVGEDAVAPEADERPSGGAPERGGSDCRQGGPVVRCDTPGINLCDNTITKAWRRYADATGFAPDLNVELIKGIPHGAGLGGGSADAALMLRYLQRHCPAPLPAERLNELAARVGADVPFFLEGHPCLAEGIGEKLTPCGPEALRPLSGLWIVLLCPARPEAGVSTVWAFRAWDEAAAQKSAPGSGGSATRVTEPEADTDGTEGGPALPLTGGNKADKNHGSGFQPLLMVENDFEPVVFAARPQLAGLKLSLLREGAAAAGMSGSGASLFGFFREEETARSAADRLKQALAGSAFAVYGPMPLPVSCQP